MKTITVRVADDKNSELLSEILKSMNFVEAVEVVDEDDSLTSEEIAMVEERWEEYQKNPDTAKDWNAVYQDMKKKYGR